MERTLNIMERTQKIDKFTKRKRPTTKRKKNQEKIKKKRHTPPKKQIKATNKKIYQFINPIPNKEVNFEKWELQSLIDNCIYKDLILKTKKLLLPSNCGELLNKYIKKFPR